jgi:predicted metal-dependent hydrolase
MSQYHIRHGEKELSIDVTTAKCRYIDLDIGNDLSVKMKVPIGMSRDMMEQYVDLYGEDIIRAYEKKAARNHQSLPETLDLENGRVHYRSGMKLPFLGEMDTLLRIKYHPDHNGASMYTEKGAGRGRSLVIRTENDEQDFIRFCIMRYYRKRSEKIVRNKIERFAADMELTYNSFRVSGGNSKAIRSRFPYAGFSSRNIDVKNQTTIWGSCNRKRNLKFDWKLAMLPEEVIDYIIVHELTHLKKMNHSKAFWAEVAQVMPEYGECRRWLDKHGKEYEIF